MLLECVNFDLQFPDTSFEVDDLLSGSRGGFPHLLQLLVEGGEVLGLLEPIAALLPRFAGFEIVQSVTSSAVVEDKLKIPHTIDC